MLDFDLAQLYDVETKVLNQAVKRNIDRFPDDFMFRLTGKEWHKMRSQIVTSSSDNDKEEASPQKKRRTDLLPYAFTEHGVTMLASVLRSDKAVKMNIAIVRAFIGLRKMALQYAELTEQLKELKGKIGNHDTQLNQIYDAIENLLQEKQEHTNWTEREKIGFKKS